MAKEVPLPIFVKPPVKGMQLIAAEVEQPIQLINASLCLPKPYLSFGKSLPQLNQFQYT